MLGKINQSANSGFSINALRCRIYTQLPSTNDFHFTTSLFAWIIKRIYFRIFSKGDKNNVDTAPSAHCKRRLIIHYKNS